VDHDPLIYTSQIAGMMDMKHHAQFIIQDGFADFFVRAGCKM
jgi:hypothetical protein